MKSVCSRFRQRHSFQSAVEMGDNVMKAKIKKLLRNSGVRLALNIIFIYLAYSAVIMTTLDSRPDLAALDTYREMAYFLDGWN